MSGHSRWAQVKHKKAGTDAKRGTRFSKLARLISVAAREGGVNPNANPRLRQAMEHARSAGLPKENIERAVLRGSGAAGERAEIVTYEAYGPGGFAILASGVTDNPNRTTNEVKRLLDRHGGKLANAGSVAWMFNCSLAVVIDPGERAVEDIELALIDAGAEDTERDHGRMRALVPLERAAAFETAIAERGVTPAERTYAVIPRQFISLAPDDHARGQALVEALDDHPDITEVATNIDEGP